MGLAFNARSAKKDVDAIFEPTAAVVAQDLELPADWLNDAVKGFLSVSGDFDPVSAVDLPNLRVQAPTPEYMLAMKVVAARTGADSERGDSSDIAFLIRLLSFRDAESVMDIVRRNETIEDASKP